MRWVCTVISAVLWFHTLPTTNAGLVEDAVLREGRDLASYVSRPDIRAPLWKVTKHVPDLIAPGYWFVSPYDKWKSAPIRREYMPYQVGPHIYDGDGNLIWSGAHVNHNRVIHEFRPYDDGVKIGTTYILRPTYEQRNIGERAMYVVMDDRFRTTATIVANTSNLFELNGHELKMIDKGRKALTLSSTPKALVREGGLTVHYLNDCVVEWAMPSGDRLFEWCALDHGVEPEETFEKRRMTSEESPWDFMHTNSVDKFDNGDYLISARFTNTLYRISGTDKSIVWRLGGKTSDFVMDFSFSSQHHATVISSNESTVVLTVLDNASGEVWRNRDTAETSSALMVALYTSERPMRAKLLYRWKRPDGGLTRKRGNVNILPNGNVWIGWSEQSYLSEHTMDGRLLLEAKWTSTRFSTYRAFKGAFIGRPTEAPALKAFQYDTGDDSLIMIYVSWNGDTEVSSWQFLGYSVDSDTVVAIDTVPRTGFETSLSASGIWDRVYAVGLDTSGHELGRSKVTLVTIASQISSSRKGGSRGQGSSSALAVRSVICTLVFQAACLIAFRVYKKRSVRPWRMKSLDLSSKRSPLDGASKASSRSTTQNHNFGVSTSEIAQRMSVQKRL
ncbi:Isotrichodermin C-15 hydroxylase [Sphaceloma murrayae]|uniref:Isotrichodermin C-15 hydroxylase n=1 Tax=Sphaceloma murrayae TaxID=2082308 RepID=A0A2K1QHC9_9PEZI|nr:Isotrichodermin C-15 hydroxylase [Sphaceloma murrayae]